MSTTLVTLQPNEVTLVVSSGNDFRVENVGKNTVRIAYATTPPLTTDQVWGTLPRGGIEVRVVGDNFYCYCPQECDLSVAQSLA